MRPEARPTTDRFDALRSDRAAAASASGLLGVLTPLLVSQLTAMKTVITWWSLVLAFGISGAVGIIFRLYPASRAAALHPIEEGGETAV